MTEKPRCAVSAGRAVHLLLQQEITTLYTDVQLLELGQRVLFDSIDHYCQITGASLYQFTRRGALRDGCTICVGSRYLVLYNDVVYRSPDRLNWTLAHELGHICNGHGDDGWAEEAEANAFACELLMPEIVIRFLASRQRISYLDLQELFHVSGEAAQNRIRQLKSQRDYCATWEERKLLQKYLPLLRRIRL